MTISLRTFQTTVPLFLSFIIMWKQILPRSNSIILGQSHSLLFCHAFLPQSIKPYKFSTKGTTRSFLTVSSSSPIPRATVTTTPLLRLFSSTSSSTATNSNNSNDNSSSSSSSSNNNNNNHKKKTPTAPLSSSSSSSQWNVPKSIDIPQDRLEFSYVRSSGAGGQNVNKVNTQVQLRFRIQEHSDWIPYEVQERFQQQQKHRINKDGICIITAQEHRTQIGNRKAVIHKLQSMLQQAWIRPKQRNVRQGISMKTKEQRKEFKRRRSEVKERRRKVDF